MARQVMHTVAQAQHAQIEAGTGSGKSFAYLIPLIWHRRDALVSTANKALQNQLWEKDIPALQRIAPQSFIAALLKGRSNYVCQAKLDKLSKQQALPGLGLSFGELRERLEQAPSGDVEEMRLFAQDRDAVTAGRHECLGDGCNMRTECYYELARIQAEEADIVIVNHALLATNLALEGKVLRPRDVVIIDEAHELEGFVIGAKRTSLEYGQVPALVNDPTVAGNVDENTRRKALSTNQRLFTFLNETAGENGDQRWAAPQELPLAQALGFQVDAIYRQLMLRYPAVPGGDRNQQNAQHKRVMEWTSELTKELLLLGRPVSGEQVRYCEKRQEKRPHARVSLHQEPVHVGGFLRETLWDATKTVICTSATLAVNGGFDYFRRQTGAPIEGVASEIIDSPFDYPNQALLYIPDGLFPRYDDADAENAYVEMLTAEVERLLRASRGRAFVLCTSARRASQLFDLLKPQLPFPCYHQGKASREELLDRFRGSCDGAVLFATKSFWEGVDVPGEALSLVIIDKMPFAPRGDPVVQQRERRIRAAGGNPFLQYTLPEAIIALKQGVGRLIRRETDRGVMAILDSRVNTKRYGLQVIASLPPAKRTLRFEDVKRFFGAGGDVDQRVTEKRTAPGVVASASATPSPLERKAASVARTGSTPGSSSGADTFNLPVNWLAARGGPTVGALEDLYNKAHGNLRRRQYRAALDKLEKINRADPSYRDVRSLLTSTRRSLADHKRAQRHKKLLAHAKDKMHAGKWKLAISDIGKILADDPAYPGASDLLKEVRQRKQSARKQAPTAPIASTQGAPRQAAIRSKPSRAPVVTTTSPVASTPTISRQPAVRASPSHSPVRPPVTRDSLRKSASTVLGAIQAGVQLLYLRFEQAVRRVSQVSSTGLALSAVAVALIILVSFLFIWRDRSSVPAPTAMVVASSTLPNAPTIAARLPVTPEAAVALTALGSPAASPTPSPTPNLTPTPGLTASPTSTPVPIPGSAGADLIVAYNPGPGAEARCSNPDVLLGEADGVEDPEYEGILQLGRGGSVLTAFTDNTIIDREGSDFEVHGESAADDFILVEVSADGSTWYAFPKMPEATGGLDLAEFGLAEAVYVRLTDVQPGTVTGAEVDAVVALHSGIRQGSRLPDLPDAVTREDLSLSEGPSNTTSKVGEVEAGSPVVVLGRDETSRWVKVRTEESEVGWLPIQGLGLNVTLKEYWVLPTPTTESISVTAPTSTARPAPTPTPRPKWILVADSRSDYPSNTGERKWWYLWSSGTNNFYWQDMTWDDPSWCYRSPNDWNLRICQDRIQTDARGDVALQWKATQGGTYRFEWDSAALSFYMHLSYVGSQGSGTELAYSATIRDVIDWELFFWVARGYTSYHVKVYRLQE